ncbi:MAG: DNA polymerase III subunit delta [Anaerovoracaceae bacterium]|jgi:DNA polymerase-3 subunit delta
MAGRGKKQNTNGFREFSRDLKAGSIAGSILMTGQEEFLIDWAVRSLKKRYVNEAVELLDYRVLDDEEQTPDQIIEAASTMPVLSEKKLIWVRDAELIQSAKPGLKSEEGAVDRLIKLLETPDERILLVFSAEKADGRNKLVKALKKNASQYAFDQLERSDFTAFAAKRIHHAGLSISRSDMAALVEATGYYNRESSYRLYNFENDLTKIIALSDGGTVTREAIREAVEGDSDTFIFSLLDSISGNDKQKAFELLHNQLSARKSEALSLTGSIVSQLELLLELREFSDRGMTPREIHDYTKIHEFRVKNALKYARRYPLPKLRAMLLSAYKVNVDVVTGLLEPASALELFIAEI